MRVNLTYFPGAKRPFQEGAYYPQLNLFIGRELKPDREPDSYMHMLSFSTCFHHPPYLRYKLQLALYFIIICALKTGTELELASR